MTAPRMPVLFLGHGSPMNTLARNCYTNAWRSMGGALPRPRAIVVVSAHWYIGATAVTAMPMPRTIHDFYGFPQPLFDFQYPAPGAPDVAAEIAEVAKPLWLGLDRDQWGLDHGAWSVLAHLYPNADVPVVQLSINGLKPLEYHVELGAKLAPLRDRGMLILASGNVVHNLRRIDRNLPEFGFDWAQRFDDAVCGIMESDPSRILSVLQHADFDEAVPTPDHFIPLLYVAGLASEAQRAKAVLRGYSLGSLSMTAYAIGFEMPAGCTGAAAASLPGGVPPDQTNT